jgi:hypothetical protein
VHFAPCFRDASGRIILRQGKTSGNAVVAPLTLRATSTCNPWVCDLSGLAVNRRVAGSSPAVGARGPSAPSPACRPIGLVVAPFGATTSWASPAVGGQNPAQKLADCLGAAVWGARAARVATHAPCPSHEARAIRAATRRAAANEHSNRRALLREFIMWSGRGSCIAREPPPRANRPALRWCG